MPSSRACPRRRAGCGRRCSASSERSRCSPRLHPLATDAAIALERLAPERVIVLPRDANPAFHNAVVSMCRDAGLAPDARRDPRGARRACPARRRGRPRHRAAARVGDRALREPRHALRGARGRRARLPDRRADPHRRREPGDAGVPARAHGSDEKRSGRDHARRCRPGRLTEPRAPRPLRLGAHTPASRGGGGERLGPPAARRSPGSALDQHEDERQRDRRGQHARRTRRALRTPPPRSPPAAPPPAASARSAMTAPTTAARTRSG